MGTILVVDDSPVIRRVLSVTFERNGYEVEAAEDGEEALSIMEDVDFDIIYSDIRMPNMDGIALLQEIRKSYSSTELPVIMLTAVGEEKDRERALKHGANAILTKPSSSHEIIATLQKYIVERTL